MGQHIIIPKLKPYPIELLVRTIEKFVGAEQRFYITTKSDKSNRIKYKYRLLALFREKDRAWISCEGIGKQRIWITPEDAALIKANDPKAPIDGYQGSHYNATVREIAFFNVGDISSIRSVEEIIA